MYKLCLPSVVIKGCWWQSNDASNSNTHGSTVIPRHRNWSCFKQWQHITEGLHHIPKPMRSWDQNLIMPSTKIF